MLQRILDKARRTMAPDPAGREYELVPRGDEFDLKYRVSYHAMSHHKPVYRVLELPPKFYEQRRHIFEAPTRITTHDPLSLLLFTRLLDEIDKPEVVVAEFGVWRGSFLENLAIHARDTGKKLIIYGFDTFDQFPGTFDEKDVRSRSSEELVKSIATISPFSKDAIASRLRAYPSVKELHLIAGDITKVPPTPIQPDIVHYDMDFHATFPFAMRWIEHVDRVMLVSDDYYQPTWVGMVDAVNEFCAEHQLYPVNLSDYFRVERSDRTRFIVILLPLGAQ